MRATRTKAAPHNVNTKNSNFEVVIDLAQLFNQIKLSEINSIMIPGSKASDIADKAKLMFSISEFSPNEK